MIVSKIFFYILVGFSLLLLASVTRSLREKRVRSALMTLRVYLFLVAIYATVLVATTLALPVTTLPATATMVKGDWGIDATSVRRTPHGKKEDVEIDLRMTNRGQTSIHGEDLIAYLLTGSGTRYDPQAEPSTPPFTAEIQPKRYLYTTRRFVIPANEDRIELVLTRHGFRWESLFIGRYPFDGRTVIVLVTPQ